RVSPAAGGNPEPVVSGIMGGWRMMTAALRVPTGAIALALLAGCSHVRLEPPAPVASAQVLPARVEIPPETAQAEYVVQSFMAGAAHKWNIHAGGAGGLYAE